MIHLKDVNKTYQGAQPLHVLKGISLDIERGEFVSIMGASGSGKSTLLNILGILDNYDSGEYRLNDVIIKDLSETRAAEYRNKMIGFIFQSFNLISFKTAVENVELPLFYQGVGRRKRHELAMQYLDKLGLAQWANHYPNEMSGGQKQRVAIARALATNPKILLCDEATSALDPQTTESILKLLKKINREMGVTILLITHQMQVVQMICNKVAVMENGQVVEAGSVLDVFGKPQAPVTRRFVQTVVNDQIPESILSLVKEQKEHFRVERLKFIGSSVKRPVISDICHVDGIVVNILGATVQELQENVMCVFILQLIGTEEKILEAEKQIDGNGVIRERVEAI